VIFGRLRETLRNTRAKLADGLGRLFGVARELDDAFLAELEAVLYSGDLGPTGHAVLETLRGEYRERKLKTTADVRARLRELLKSKLGEPAAELKRPASGPAVILVVGVNGSGKTTSVAKLARLLKGEGRSVIVAACDTFRAAAVEQLSTWAQRIGVPVVKKQAGADPAAVAFDAASQAAADAVDFLIVDTAGRLHTRDDLMAELGKVRRVLDKKIPGAPHETLLVMDATTGQNGLQQARQFTESAGVTGIVLTKLDGTAKGGVVVAISRELGVPVRYVGVGEKAGDLLPFDPKEFVDSLFA